MASTFSHDAEISQPPSFFKIFLPEHNSHKLPIPQNFIKNLDGSIYKKTLLQNSEGKFWMVELETTRGRLMINKGWQDFVQAHDLKTGNILIFKYNGGFVFNVKIFGLDCCIEKECAATTKRPISGEKLSQPMASILKFTKAFGKILRDSMKLPVYVGRRCKIESRDETVLRTMKGGESCSVTFEEIGGNYYIGGKELKNFWKKINVEPRDRCKFYVHLTTHGKVKEIVVANVTRFVSIAM